MKGKFYSNIFILNDHFPDKYSPDMFGGEGEEGGVLVEDVADGGGGVDTPPE